MEGMDDARGEPGGGALVSPGILVTRRQLFPGQLARHQNGELGMMVEGSAVQPGSVPSLVEVYHPGKTGIHKFQCFYGQNLLHAQGFHPVWTGFDLDIVGLVTAGSPVVLVEHGYDGGLFDSLNARFAPFAVIDPDESRRRTRLQRWLARRFGAQHTIGIWEAKYPALVEYFAAGDGVGRGAFWYLYALRCPVTSGELVPLIHEYGLKYRKLLDAGTYDPSALRGEDIVVHPSVTSFVFKDFTSARLGVSTSAATVADKIVDTCRNAAVAMEHRMGDVSLTCCSHLSERAGFRITRK